MTTPTINDSLRIATRIGGFFVIITIAATVALVIAFDSEKDPFLRTVLPLGVFTLGLFVSALAFLSAVTNERNHAQRRQNIATDVELDRKRLEYDIAAARGLAEVRVAEATALAEIRIREATIVAGLPAASKASGNGHLVTSTKNPKQMLLNPSLSPRWTFRLKDGREARGELIELLHDYRDVIGDKREMIRDRGVKFGNKSFTAANDAWVEVGGQKKLDGDKYEWIEPRYKTIGLLAFMREGNLTPSIAPPPSEDDDEETD